MSTDALSKLLQHGQSVWYDNIHRAMIQSGDLQRLVDEGVRGVTSNPTIFRNAISQGKEYLEDVNALSRQGKSPAEIVDALIISDVGAAADVLRPVYDTSDGLDGYVSIEVNPSLAHDTTGTIAEARRLFATLDRPNIMIKVPGTAEGIPTIRELIGAGVNINVTLLFAVEMYRNAAEAYIDGLEIAASGGRNLTHIASVASFFVSRVDTLTDKLLLARVEAARDPSDQERVRALQGKLAIANARVAYRKYQELFTSPRFQHLEVRGARPQRLLWASTSTKDPAYRDVVYVEELIGRPTVNTMPPQTLRAFQDHGQVRDSLAEDPAAAAAVLDRIEAAGLDTGAITDQLLREGVATFAQSFNDLVSEVATKM